MTQPVPTTTAGATPAVAPAGPATPLGSPAEVPTQVPAQVPADVVAAATLAVDGVVALHPGAFGEVATLLPGRKVSGVRLAEPGDLDATSEVHVVAAAEVPVTTTAAAVHTALARLVPGRLHVVVGDVRTRAEQADQSTTAS